MLSFKIVCSGQAEIEGARHPEGLVMRSQLLRISSVVVVLGMIGLAEPSLAVQIGGPQELPDSVKLEANIPYAGTDNARQQLDLLLPVEPRRNLPLPVIVYIHGGAWQSGDRAVGHRRLAGYVSDGEYAGVSVGYRLTGEEKWPAQIHDCKAAIRWIRGNADKYNLDPTRIGVIGDSAGGHLVAMLGTSGDVEELEGSLGTNKDFSSRVQCVVDQFGPSDLLAMKDYPSRLDHDAASSPEGMLIGGQVSANKGVATAASPITYVSQDDPPFLIIHGNKDLIVPYNQSQRLSASLKNASVECYFVTVDGAGHGGFLNPEVLSRQRQFFDKHLRGVENEISEGMLANRAVDDVPLVFAVEHTGEAFATPALPEFAQLPIVRPLPDPFEWSNGSGRSTDFNDWSRRRSEIKAEIENYGIGKKPPRPTDIQATFADGRLTVTLMENGETLTLTRE